MNSEDRPSCWSGLQRSTTAGASFQAYARASAAVTTPVRRRKNAGELVQNSERA